MKHSSVLKAMDRKCPSCGNKAHFTHHCYPVDVFSCSSFTFECCGKTWEWVPNRFGQYLIAILTRIEYFLHRLNWGEWAE